MIFALYISDEILSGAVEEDVAFLVVGDPFGSVTINNSPILCISIYN